MILSLIRGGKRYDFQIDRGGNNHLAWIGAMNLKLWGWRSYTCDIRNLLSGITQPLSRNFFLDHGNAIFKDSLLTNFYGYYSTLKALTLL